MDKKAFAIGIATSAVLLGALFLLQPVISPQQVAQKPAPAPAQAQVPAQQIQQPAPLPAVLGSGSISGTGTWRTEIAREEVALQPSCFTYVTRVGKITFSGFIQNELEKGRYETHGGLVDRCAEPFQGPFRLIFKLEEVTVAGRKGGLVIEVTGTFTGDVTSSQGVRTMNHLEILSGSGGLAGIKGKGIAVGRGTITESTNVYYLEIELPG